jgi:hypothetical protein
MESGLNPSKKLDYDIRGISKFLFHLGTESKFSLVPVANVPDEAKRVFEFGNYLNHY